MREIRDIFKLRAVRHTSCPIVARRKPAPAFFFLLKHFSSFGDIVFYSPFGFVLVREEVKNTPGVLCIKLMKPPLARRGTFVIMNWNGVRGVRVKYWAPLEFPFSVEGKKKKKG